MRPSHTALQRMASGARFIGAGAFARRSRSTSAILLVAAALALAGCQSAPRAQPGMATLTVRVAAEPKKGFRPPAEGDDYGGSGGASAGSSASARFGPFAAVDYRRVGNVIVVVEPDGSPPTFEDGARPPAATPGSTSQSDGAQPSRSTANPHTTEFPIVTIAVRDEHARDAGRGATVAAGVGADAVGEVFAATVGARIRVVNAGGQSQTIYSLSQGNEFDLGSIPAGEIAEATVRAPGLIELLCESRESPVGWVYAATSPWIQRTDSRSNIIFANLPPGRYRVSCWHPRLPASSSVVRLDPDASTRVELKLGVDQLPARP